MTAATKLSALALVPDEAAWPEIQALRSLHDSRQFPVWPPHVNILYPFVQEADFSDAARRLAEATAAIGPMKLRFSRLGRFGRVAFLAPECDDDPGLAKLYEACASAFPELPLERHAFCPHLTVGQFRSAAECRSFLDGAVPIVVDVEIACLSMLARDTMKDPFRTPIQVRLGDGVCAGDVRPYAPDPEMAAAAERGRCAALAASPCIEEKSPVVEISAVALSGTRQLRRERRRKSVSSKSLA